VLNKERAVRFHLRTIIHVDEELTERRDEGSLDGVEGTPETGGLTSGFSVFEPLTSDF
jgi:hypothetical protein